MEEFELAAQKYAEVQKCLDINKSRKNLKIYIESYYICTNILIHLIVSLFDAVPWQLSIDTLKLAGLQLDTDQTQHFLDLYLFKIISLMSSQR